VVENFFVIAFCQGRKDIKWKGSDESGLRILLKQTKNYEEKFYLTN